MKPDPGQKKDAERRVQKKAEKAAAKAARKHDRAVAEDATLSVEAQAARADLHKHRGARRTQAWSTLLGLDRQAALDHLWGLVRAAEGKRKAELGALLLRDGDDSHRDAAVAGRLGDVSIFDVAKDAFADTAARVAAAIERTHPPPQAKDLDAIAVRLGLLSPGIVSFPVDARVVAALPGVVTALIDRGAAAGPAEVPGLRLRLGTLLLLSRPSALWIRRDVVMAGADRDDVAIAHAVVLAGVAHGVDVTGAEGGVSEAAVDAALAWLMARPERTAAFMGMGLPAMAERCAPRVRRSLWRAVFLDDAAPAAARDRAAAGLWQHEGPDAAHTLLLRPMAAMSILSQVLSALHIEELDDVIAAHVGDVAFRDALATSRHGRSVVVTRAVRAFVDDDPVGVGAVFARSEDASAVDDCAAIVEHAPAAVAAAVVVGALAESEALDERSSSPPRPPWSLAALRHAVAKDADAKLSASLENTVGGVDPVFTLAVLRALIRRGDAHAYAADMAIARIIRRFSLANR